MRQGALRIELPESLSPAAQRSSLDQAFGVLAKDLRARIEPALIQALGPGWVLEVGLLYRPPDRQGNPDDPAFLLKEILRSDSPARSCLPRTKPWLDLARDVRVLRNDFAHHTHVVGPATRDGLAKMGLLVSAAELPASRDIQALLARFDELQDGTYAADDLSEERRHLDRDDRELTAQQRGREVEQAHSTAKEAEAERDRARAERDQEAATTARLRTQLDSRDGDARELKRQLVDAGQRLGVKERSYGVAQARATTLGAALVAATNRAEKAERERDDVEARATAEVESLRTLIATLEHDKAPPRGGNGAATDSSRMGASKPPGITTRLESLRERLDEVEHAAMASASSPVLGEPWPFEVGYERWRLSGAQRTLSRYDDDEDLASVIGSPAADRIVSDMLRVRPSGGRILVDEDGDAVTWLKTHFVFVGNLRNEASDTNGPTPGAPIPGPPVGRRYRMTIQGVIEDKVNGESLDAVAPRTAAAVRERMLAVRPKGGAFWVDEDGNVSARDGGVTIFVTRVHANEWWPGHVKPG